MMTLGVVYNDLFRAIIECITHKMQNANLTEEMLLIRHNKVTVSTPFTAFQVQPPRAIFFFNNIYIGTHW